MPRLLSLGTALAVAAVSIASFAPSGAADAATKSSVNKTYYIMSGSGYGTSVTGGSLPANVGKTGLVTMGCVSVPGKVHKTETAGVGNGVIPDVQVGVVGGNIHSQREHGGLGVITTHHIASITVGDPSVGTLNIGAITSEANAYHNASGYHTDHQFNIASINASLAGQSLPALPLDSLTQLLKGIPLTVPGLATISLSTVKDQVRQHSAFAQTRALTIKVLPTNTTIVVGSAQARIRDTDTNHLFRGEAELVGESSALAGVVTLGNNTKLPMPCDGTHGKVKTDDVLSVPLSDPTGSLPANLGLSIGAGTTWNRAAYDKAHGTAYHRESATLANINLAGQIVINALKVQANVTVDRKGKIHFNDSGSTAGSITVSGNAESLPDLSSIPSSQFGFGIASNVVTKTKNGRGIDVIGLQINLGPLATINLGHVHAEINRSIYKLRKHR